MADEVRERVWLIALRCHMQYIDALIILRVNISTRHDKHINKLRITMVGSIMKWWEAAT